MCKDLKNEKKTNNLKEKLKTKYSKLYTLSEKLFDKIYLAESNKNDLIILEKMIKMKMEKDNGNITKLNADKQIGETLCDIYVKPILKNKEKK
tara:strand:+ start:1559 stop:1837 length:279 start_codon:yes stop_codon:yes gene_type:complete